MTPTVGVIIPCYNQGLYLHDCVTSILTQTWQRWRAVVLDDASTDDITTSACAAIRSDRVTVVHLTRNLGRALIRNRGLAQLGDVDYVLNIDSDDILTDDYIEKLVTALECMPSAGLAYGLLHYFGQGSEGRVWPNERLDIDKRYLENRVPGPGTMFRRLALGQTKGWRKEFTNCSGEDYDIWLQVINAGWQAIWVPEASYKYRQHAGSFLANRSSCHEIEHELAILTLHRPWIERSCGIEQYLMKSLGPFLFTRLHNLDAKGSASIGLPLFRQVPRATARMVASHYIRSIKSRLRLGLPTA